MSNTLVTGWYEVDEGSLVAQAMIGRCMLNVHENGLHTSPNAEVDGTTQYAVAVPESAGAVGRMIVLDTGYAADVRDAKVKACQALCSFFDSAYRTMLGLVRIDPVAIECAKVDRTSARELLSDTVREANEGMIIVTPDNAVKKPPRSMAEKVKKA